MVQEGDALFELETDKITTEVAAEMSGIVSQRAAEGDTIEIGSVIGSITGGTTAPVPGADLIAGSPSAAPAPALLALPLK